MNTNYNFDYPVNLEALEEGGFLVRFPDFPEAITQGDDIKDALKNAEDCLEEAVANRMSMGLDIPFSKKSMKYSFYVSLDIILAAKCALHLVMKKNHYKNVRLAKALKCDEKVVRRLLDPKYKSKVNKIEEALKLMGEMISITVSEYQPNDYSDSHKRQKRNDDAYHASL